MDHGDNTGPTVVRVYANTNEQLHLQAQGQSRSRILCGAQYARGISSAEPSLRLWRGGSTVEGRCRSAEKDRRDASDARGRANQRRELAAAARKTADKTSNARDKQSWLDTAAQHEQ